MKMENKLQKICLTYSNLLIAKIYVSSLSNLVNNLSEGIHRNKSKYGHDDKKCKNCRIKHRYCDCFLNIQTL